jgi:hypothetical protein
MNGDTGGCLADRDRCDDTILRQVDDAYIVASLIGDVGERCGARDAADT